MSRKSRSGLRGFGTALLLLAAWRIYSRRAQERIPSQEGIEDEQVASAFNLISQMPQMRWVRSYVSRRAAELQDHGEAIDLGCGPGYLVLEMAQRMPELHVTGVDLSQELLNTAERAAQEAGLGDRVAFRTGDAQQIPFADESLDLVVSTLSLHHWGDPLTVFAEINRVLKPGGAFYIFDLRRDLAAPFYLLLWFATQVVVPAALLRVNEPMGSRNASYTPRELAIMVMQSSLRGWQITPGPLWLVLEGRKPTQA